MSITDITETERPADLYDEVDEGTRAMNWILEPRNQVKVLCILLVLVVLFAVFVSFKLGVARYDLAVCQMNADKMLGLFR